MNIIYNINVLHFSFDKPWVYYEIILTVGCTKSSILQIWFFCVLFTFWNSCNKTFHSNCNANTWIIIITMILNNNNVW